MTGEARALKALAGFGGTVMDCFMMPNGTDVTIYDAKIEYYHVDTQPGEIRLYYYAKDNPERTSEGIFIPKMWDWWEN